MGRFKPQIKPTIGLYVSSLTLIMVLYLLIATPYGYNHFNNAEKISLDGSLKIYVDDRLVYSEMDQIIDVNYQDFLICKMYNIIEGCQAVGLSGHLDNKIISAFGLSTASYLAPTCDGLILENSLDPILIQGAHDQNSNALRFAGSWIAQGDQAGIRQMFLMVFNGNTGAIDPACYVKIQFAPVDVLESQVLTIELDLLLR